METFDLIKLYFNSVKSEGMEITDYSINGSIIKITYKRYVKWITDGKDESWWNYDSDNFIEVELLDYITFLFNNK